MSLTEAGSENLLVEASRALGNTMFLLGDSAGARPYLEKSLTLYDPQRHRSHVLVYGTDPGVASRSVSAMVLWNLGYPDQARERSANRYRWRGAWTSVHAGLGPELCGGGLPAPARAGRVRGAEERASRSRRITATHSGRPPRPSSAAVAWPRDPSASRTASARWSTALLAAWQATGAEAFRPYYLSLLADGLRRSGDVDRGLTVLDEAQAVVEQHSERWWQPDLLRIRGELLRRVKRKYSGSPAAAAEQYFMRAIQACPQPGRKVLGVASDAQPRPLVAAAGPGGRSQASGRRDLRLVHRGLRDLRLARGAGFSGYGLDHRPCTSRKSWARMAARGAT